MLVIRATEKFDGDFQNDAVSRDTDFVTTICPQALLGGGALSAQTLEVSPNRVPPDETAAIRTVALQPDERVTMRSELTDGAGERWPHCIIWPSAALAGTAVPEIEPEQEG